MEYVGNILYDEKLLDKGKKFIIFGAGLYGKKVLDYLDLNGVKESIICFCDSDTSKDILEIDGIPVYHTIDTFKRYPNAEYLISGNYSKEMYKILKENDIRKIHLLMI